MSRYNADDSDKATELEEHHRAQMLKRMAERMKPPSEFDSKHCVECGDEIISARLAIGKWTCIYCQTRLDSYNKQRGIK